MNIQSDAIDSGHLPNYDRHPFIPSTGGDAACFVGWDAIADRLCRQTAQRARTILVVDCYTGVDVDEVRQALSQRLKPELIVDSRDAFLPPDRIDCLVSPFLGGDDPVFGFLCGLKMEQFLDLQKLKTLRMRIETSQGLVLVVGEGATALHKGDILVYADMPRWEGQLRQRRNEVCNLGVRNADLKASLQYKRSYFVDWRVCDRWKKPLLRRADFFLDSTSRSHPKMAEGDDVRRALAQTPQRPFRVVPFFDPGPWGGQWMRRVFGLDGYTLPEPANYAWCFDCVPEENSLLLGFGEHRFELPSVNLIFSHPRELLGDPVHARFGDE